MAPIAATAETSLKVLFGFDTLGLERDDIKMNRFAVHLYV